VLCKNWAVDELEIALSSRCGSTENSEFWYVIRGGMDTNIENAVFNPENKFMLRGASMQGGGGFIDGAKLVRSIKLLTPFTD
jgi:hypothetical protein